VPIPVIVAGGGADLAGGTMASLDVGAWIEPPCDGGKSYWVLESKVTDTYGLMYYSSMPRIGVVTDEDGDMEAMRVESIGDILYVKFQEGEIVDVDADEVEDVVKVVGELFS
jgi:hypothetical protein